MAFTKLSLVLFLSLWQNILAEENLGGRGSIKLPIPNHAPLRGERQERNLKQLVITTVVGREIGMQAWLLAAQPALSTLTQSEPSSREWAIHL